MAEDIKDKVLAQSIAAGIGATYGAVTKSVFQPPRHSRGGMAAQVGSAMGAAASRGAGVKGSVAAGAAVVTAKAAAVTAGAAVAAPFVIGAAAVGLAGYGIYKLFKR